MGHHITAIILKGNFEENNAKAFDLQPIRLKFDLTLFHIDHYYSACWQHQLGLKEQLDTGDIDCFCFPKEIVLAKIMQSITGNDTSFLKVKTIADEIVTTLAEVLTWKL